VAIDRRCRLAGALIAALAVSACKPEVSRCKSGTLLVAVTLDGSAAGADSFAVTISLDGGSGVTSTLAHTPGVASGNVEVQFPSGYPTGSSVSVDVVAYAGGGVVGHGATTATLVQGCQATTLAIAATTELDDLSVTTDAGDDLSMLGANDLSPPADLSLSPPADMACAGGGVELCFNGIDDDCDGHVDCDDPDCAPVAVCVPPATGSFTYDTQEAAGATCPSSTTGTPIYGNSDPTGGGCNNSCSCSSSGCTSTLTTINGCPGGSPAGTLLTASATCQNISGQNNWREATPTGSMSCASSGTASPVMPAVVPTAESCGDNLVPVAGGCTNGKVCVPRGTKQCVIATGAAACPSGYPSQATWFTSFTDNRTCSCSCAPGANGCAGSQLTLYKSYFMSTCSGSTKVVSGDVCDTEDYQGIKLAGGCNLTVTTNNPLVFNGQKTVCCE